MRFFILFFFLSSFTCYSQKDSLQIGDRYADDQIYFSISYSQLQNQPSGITKSNFSYSYSVGFLKDIILSKQGDFSVALGVGYGVDFFNHNLKVTEVNDAVNFSSANGLQSNKFKAKSLEIPFELRWRTSTVKKYKFWRIYPGFKMLYNLSNRFDYTDPNDSSFSYKNIAPYSSLQYGLTLSAGYDAFNFNMFYGLSSLFDDAFINTNQINTSVLKFGFIFYIL